MSKVTKEMKELKVKEYKDMFLVLYKIFGGVLPRKYLKELCLRYNYFANEDSFNSTIALLDDYDLIETTYIAGSELKMLKIKQFAVDQLEGKRSRGVKFSTDKVLESYMKYRIITKNTALNSLGAIRLEEFYNIVNKNTTFWAKEKSPVSINNWLDDKYTLTQEGKDAVERGLVFERNRNKNLKSNDEVEVSNEKVITALDYMELKKDKKAEYTENMDFSKIRNRSGFINDLSSLMKEKSDILRIETLITSQEAPDFNSLGKYVYDCIYLASQHLDGIEHLYINLNFVDVVQMNNSFNSCFEFRRDEKGITRDDRNILDKMNNYSKSKMSTAFKPFNQAMDKDKYKGVFAYKLRFGVEDKIKDRNIYVHLTFRDFNVYKELYGAEKAEAMVAVSKSRAEERREERKYKDSVVNRIVKLDKDGNLYKLERLVKELNEHEITKLIKFVKEM